MLRQGAAALALSAAGLRAVRAGAQVEEPLSDAVRSALSAAVSELLPSPFSSPALRLPAGPPRPRFDDPRDRVVYEGWRRAAGERLKRHKSEAHVREEFLDAVWYESRRAALEVELVLGLIQVESAFRKYAISPAGARGYMQVMPFWTRLIGDGDAGRLFHLQTNLRFGCTILRHYLAVERGELALALGRYNGSRGRAEYPRAVLAARAQWPTAPRLRS